MQQKYFLTFLGIFLLYFQVYSQDITSYIPPSPNATALAKFANIPVSLYTGTPQVNIPFYQVQSRTLSVPISLSYHASGIKVQDLGSNVGTGWVLNAGGVITRVIRGLPDESPTGYCGPNGIGKKADDPLSKEYAEKVRNGTWDGEPDLFYFNFMGRAGRFILDSNGEAILFPKQAIQISSDITRREKFTWVITTEDGTKYHFGDSIRSVERTIYKGDNEQESNAFATSWYLDKMVDANCLDSIFFEYETAGDLEYSYYRQIATDVHKFSGANYNFCQNEANNSKNVKDVNTQIKIKNSLWIKSINHSRGQILFKHHYNRADIKNAGMLNWIDILDENGKRIKAYDFDYWFTNLGKASERMFLEQIKEIGGVLDYEILAYGFEYNKDVNLPARNSHQIDHWGYYNSNPYPSKIPKVTFDGKTYEGADKEADPVRTQANILTQINYATGGYTKFVYEPHRYGTLNKLAGGVRIKQMIESDGMDESKNIIKNYSYTLADKPSVSSGQVYRIPTYYHTTYNQKTITDFNLNVIFCKEDYIIRSSHSYADLFDMNGAHIGYSYVTVTLPDQSKMTYSYTNFTDYPDELPEKVNYKSPEESTIIPPNEPPFAPSTFKGWRRGLPKEEAVYDAENKLQKKVSYAYTPSNHTYPKAIAWVAYVKGNLQTCINECHDYGVKTPLEWSMARYEVITEAWLLYKKTEETYDQGQTEKKIVQTTQLSYTDYLQLREQIQYRAGDDKRYITEYKYCTDYPYNEPTGDSNLWGWYMLYEKGIIAQPTEIIQHYQTIKDEPIVTLGSTLNLFKVQFSGKDNKTAFVLLAATLAFKTEGILDFNYANIAYNPDPKPHFYIDFDKRYDTLITFDKYDKLAYLREKTTHNVHKTYYKWSYKTPDASAHNLLVAEATHHPIILFSDFEGSEEDFVPSKQINITVEGREGSKGVQLVPDKDYLVQSTLLNPLLTDYLPSDKYLFSCWIKTSTAGNMTVTFKLDNDNNKIIKLQMPFENTNDSWVYIEDFVALPFGNILHITLDTDKAVRIDDLMLHLPDTPAKTYIYELPYGMKAITDIDKKVTRYKYDEWGKLKMLLDEENDIRKHYEYHYTEDK